MPSAVKSASVVLNQQHQNLESVNRVVANVLGRAGCPACGRIAFLNLQFHGDPAPDLVKEGVVSMHIEGA